MANAYIFHIPHDWVTQGPRAIAITATDIPAALDLVRDYVAKTEITGADGSIFVKPGQRIDLDAYATALLRIFRPTGEITKDDINTICSTQAPAQKFLLQPAIALTQNKPTENKPTENKPADKPTENNPPAAEPETVGNSQTEAKRTESPETPGNKADSADTKTSETKTDEKPLPLILRNPTECPLKTFILYPDGTIESQTLNAKRQKRECPLDRLRLMLVLTSEGPDKLQVLTPGKTKQQAYDQIYALPLPQNAIFMKYKYCGCFDGRCVACIGIEEYDGLKTFGDLYAKVGTWKTAKDMKYISWPTAGFDPRPPSTKNIEITEGACYGPQKTINLSCFAQYYAI